MARHSEHLTTNKRRDALLKHLIQSNEKLNDGSLRYDPVLRELRKSGYDKDSLDHDINYLNQLGYVSYSSLNRLIQITTLGREFHLSRGFLHDYKAEKNKRILKVLSNSFTVIISIPSALLAIASLNQSTQNLEESLESRVIKAVIVKVIKENDSRIHQ